MSDWPLPSGNRKFESVGTNTSDSTSTTIASSGSGDTKGSWVELIAATTFNASSLTIRIVDYTVSVEQLFDIAIGAASSEEIIINNIVWSTRSIRSAGYEFTFPVSIPAGSRISCRAQSNDGSSTLALSAVIGVDSYSSASSSKIFTYGAVTATTSGATIDPGGVLNTKGTYTELIAATTLPLRWIGLIMGNRDNGTRTATFGLLDIAIGAAASEQVILPNIAYAFGDNGDMIMPTVFLPSWTDIPEGTRISIRAQCNITDAEDRLFDVIAYGGA